MAAGGLAVALLLTTPAPATAAGVGAAQQDRGVAATVAEDLTWEAVTFGQSTDLNFASNVLPEKVGTNYARPEVPGTIEGSVVVESRGGKIAPGHDGLTFYQTALDPNTDNFVLTVDMTVEQFGPETGTAPSTQDSAGIMVRDVNGPPRRDPMELGFEELPAASNMFGAGLMRQGVVSLARTGVTEPWGTVGSELDTTAFTTDPAYQLPVGTPVSLRLERTDTEFVMSTTFTHAGEPATFTQRVAGADWVQDQDPDHMYVGFYAARNALVTFENASLELSEADTQPRVDPEPLLPAPSLTLLSPPDSSVRDYTLRARPTYDGTLTVTRDGTPIASSPVSAGEPFSHEIRLTREGTTGLSLTYTPTDGPSRDPLTQTLTVTHAPYGDTGPHARRPGVHASPDGTSAAAGTADDPVDLATALRFVAPGHTVFLHGGTYQPTAEPVIARAYSGLPDAPKRLAPYDPAEPVVIDGRDILPNGLRLDADHWRVDGFRITHAAANGMRVSGSHNTIRGMVFDHNLNTGFQISGTGGDPTLWPAHNLVASSESHDNRDLTDINADGFAAKLGIGPGNVFRNNVSHHNIDDGWDLYNRINEGANHPILLENNIAYANGQLSDGYHEDGDTGNGFKLGGEGLPVAHVVRGNLAFGNNMDGFSDNFNPGELVLTNNTAFNNKRFNFLMRSNPYVAPEDQGTYRDNISLRTAGEPVPDFISGDVDRTNFLSDGERSTNEPATDTVTARDFASLTPPTHYTFTREGRLAYGDFLRLAPRSPLNHAGTDHGHVGALAWARGRG
ncbi:exopolygalacturonate lyase [Streptomyces mayteni]